MSYDTASSANLPSLYICLARNVLGPGAGCHSCHASCEGTGLQPCLTALETAREQWLTAGMELVAAAGLMSSKFGCGITAGVSHAWVSGSLSPRPSCSGGQPSLTHARRGTRAAETLKRRRDERGADCYRQ